MASLMNAESSGRTTIMLSDLIVALVDFGFNLKGLSEPSRRRQYRGFKERTLPLFECFCYVYHFPLSAWILPVAC